MHRLAALVVFLPALAAADPAPPAAVTRLLGSVLSGGVADTTELPQLAITNGDVDSNPTSFGALIYPNNVPSGRLVKPVVAIAADGSAGWVASDVAPDPCVRGALPDDTTGDSSYYEGERCMWNQKGAFARATLLAKATPKGWQPIAWHIYGVAPGYVGPAKATDLTANVPAGAKDAVAVFAASLGDPKALAKTLSARKDVVLFGSASGERFVGAKQIGAALAKWSLAFKVRGGTVAGVAGSSVAWVTANVEARSTKNARAKPTFYRVLFIYEHTGDTWQLVQASFSDLEPMS